MKRLLLLVGFVLLGAAVSVALYLFLVFFVLEPLRSIRGGSPESYLGIVFLILLPLSLCFGSGITGYLSSPYFRSKVGFVLVTPGLYLVIALETQLLLNYHRLIPWYAASMLVVQFGWFFASWAGVGIGHVLRRAVRA